MGGREESKEVSDIPVSKPGGLVLAGNQCIDVRMRPTVSPRGIICNY